MAEVESGDKSLLVRNLFFFCFNKGDLYNVEKNQVSQVKWKKKKEEETDVLMEKVSLVFS